MTSIQDRLAAFLAELNISVQSFERECKLGVATASRLSENSRTTTFTKIAKAYPQLNMEWLKTGRGDMLRPMPVIDIDVNKSRVGGDQVLIGDMVKIGNPDVLRKVESTELAELRAENSRLKNELLAAQRRIISLMDQLQTQCR